MIPPEIQQALNAVAEKYGREMMQQVRRALEKYRRSGQLVDSVDLTITKATDTNPPVIIVSYADQGFYIGQRQPQWTRLPDVSNLEEWSKHVQLTGPVPGYKNGLAPNLPPWKANLRRLWAIAKNKQKYDTHRPKRWKREAKLVDIIREINTETTAAFSAEVERILTSALEGTS